MEKKLNSEEIVTANIKRMDKFTSDSFMRLRHHKQDGKGLLEQITTK